MNQAIQRVEPGSTGALAASVVIKGDLSGLNEGQLATYYVQLCESLELNPLTRPFSLLVLNGKKVLYANKDCSDQLRSKRKVSVSIVSREQMDDLIVVTARATLPDGRCDESIGALPLGKLQGEARANALMKCETKAKRRVTLSICGLGMMDESEVEGALADHSMRGGTLSPHLAPDEDADAQPGDGGKLGEELLQKLEKVKAALARCDTYDKAMQLRAIIGTRAQQSDLTRRLQAGKESGDISPTQSAAIDKLWMHCDRQVAKLETKFKPPVEASFVDPDEDTAAFAPAERQPGEDDDEL